MKAKRLIEVTMPVKEISAESVRDKYIHHGHISTLHLWWARRPLPVCRAVVFASLVPDPEDENCPTAFCEAVKSLLANKHDGAYYAPYKDIPYTAINDPMKDSLRNRLLCFIGKFSEEASSKMIRNENVDRDCLSVRTLVRWESKNNSDVLKIARKLIWVAYNSDNNAEKTFDEMSNDFDEAYDAILKAESELYECVNRHIHTQNVVELEQKLKKAIDVFQSKMPSIFDPFAGGGAIPLEAARLGCRSYGNDINPVAHIIERCSLEFPQRYGKPINYSKTEFEKLYGEKGVELLKERNYDFGDFVYIPNRLTFDVEYHARLLLEKSFKEIGHVYPADGHGRRPVAYYWARTVKCTNPSCQAEIPMLKQFYLAKKKGKQVYMSPIINGNKIDFEIKNGTCHLPTWNNRGNITCPCCGSIISVNDVKRQSISHGLRPRVLAKIYDNGEGKEYRIASSKDCPELDLSSCKIPSAKMQRNSGGGDTFSWGITSWSQLFMDRQLYVIDNLVKNVHDLQIKTDDQEYNIVIRTSLALWIDRVISYSSSFGRWIPQNEQLTSLFGRQAIAMISDYPELNVFASSTSGATNQLDWVLKYLDSESSCEFTTSLCHSSSGDKYQFEKKTIDCVVTDPPYYNAIAYADISDYFYIWLKNAIGDYYPINFATPQTPKAEECTALKHHHNNNEQEAKKFFENKLLQIFKAIEYQTKGVISIMFAHQSTEAWTTLCNSIIGASMNITGSWAIDSERDTRMVANSGDALTSSVTVACRPVFKQETVSYKKVKKNIQAKVECEVKNLYELGFRGADLLTACFGKAVSEFGNYESVEKANGDVVEVAELLDLAKTSAFSALVNDFNGDDFTKFYIGWLHINGVGDIDHDDATKFTQIGLNVDISDIFSHNILIKEDNTNKQHLCTYKESAKNGLTILPFDAPLIDKVHHVMWHWAEGNRQLVLKLINEYGPDINNEFWRVFVVLKELLPADSDDSKQVTSLLSNSENLIRESKETPKAPTQATLFDIMDE